MPYCASPGKHLVYERPCRSFSILWVPWLMSRTQGFLFCLLDRGIAGNSRRTSILRSTETKAPSLNHRPPARTAPTAVWPKECVRASHLKAAPQTRGWLEKVGCSCVVPSEKVKPATSNCIALDAVLGLPFLLQCLVNFAIPLKMRVQMGGPHADHGIILHDSLGFC